jgi:hypothetical protein
VYAHNILWDPASGAALLSDFGAATLLPSGDAALRHKLQALDVRAFGCLLEELIARVLPDVRYAKVVAQVAELAQACLHLHGRERPTMVALAQHLARILGADAELA